MPTRLVFTGKHQVAYRDFALPAPGPGPGQVLVRALCSLISTGTEGIVFDRLFETGGHYDNWVTYPFHPGYPLIAEVAAVGEGVTARTVGERVDGMESQCFQPRQCVEAYGLISSRRAETMGIIFDWTKAA